MERVELRGPIANDVVPSDYRGGAVATRLLRNQTALPVSTTDDTLASPAPAATATLSAAETARALQQKQLAATATSPDGIPFTAASAAAIGSPSRSAHEAGRVHQASVQRRQEVQDEIASVLAEERRKKWAADDASDAVKLRAGKEQAGLVQQACVCLCVSATAWCM
jgi:hypothetical protein